MNPLERAGWLLIGMGLFGMAIWLVIAGAR